MNHKLFHNSNWACQYFLEAAQTGDRAVIVKSLCDISAVRGGFFVRLIKVRARPDAIWSPGEWDIYQLGGCNQTSLPVDYHLNGLLLVPPQIGGHVIVLRVMRNDVEAAGMFESTEVVEVESGGFTTLNSIYLVQRITGDQLYAPADSH